MSSMWTTLSIPTRIPVWATNSGRVLDPDDTSSFTNPTVKEQGWEINRRPPARVMNWLQNLFYLWAESQQGHILCNWTAGGSTGASTNAMIYYPVKNRFLATQASSTNTYYSDDEGTTWTAGTALAANSVPDVIGIDKGYIITGNNNNDLQYSTDGVAAWSTVTSATIGGSGSLQYLCTKYPLDDYIMVARGTSNADMRYSSSITGTWAGSSLGNPANTRPHTLLYLTGSTWACFVRNDNSNEGELAKVYISTNDGVNWSATSQIFPTGSVGALNLEQMAYNPNTGRLIVAGRKNLLASPADGVLYYSDDLGTTWTLATINNNRPNTSSYNLLKCIYYCGGTSWMATLFGYADSATNNVIYVSTDDGINWFPGGLTGLGFTGASTDTIDWVAGSEQQMVMIGRAGATSGASFASTRIVPFEFNI